MLLGRRFEMKFSSPAILTYFVSSFAFDFQHNPCTWWVSRFHVSLHLGFELTCWFCACWYYRSLWLGEHNLETRFLLVYQKQYLFVFGSLVEHRVQRAGVVVNADTHDPDFCGLGRRL